MPIRQVSFFVVCIKIISFVLYIINRTFYFSLITFEQLVHRKPINSGNESKILVRSRFSVMSIRIKEEVVLTIICLIIIILLVSIIW